MKVKLSKRLRSGLAMLLAIVMVVGMLPASALAAGGTDGEDGGTTIDYVSLGASNTNGYGIRGYLPGEVTEDPLAASKADMNVYGYLMDPPAAYPAQIAEELGKLTDKTVELYQLAISSMRTEEVLYLLGEEYDYVDDDYMKWRFTGGQKWFAIAKPVVGGSDEESINALREDYKNYLTAADVITIDLGWNNFGVYAFNNIKTILADGTYWKAPDFKATKDIMSEEDYQEIRASVLESLKNNMGSNGVFPEDKMGLMLDTLTYATLGAIGHFDSIVEQIYEWNPTAQIVVINIQNLADDLVVEFEGETLKLGDLYGELIDLVNLYRASESPYADKYAFADAGDVTTFLDEIVAWDGDPTTLGGDMKDCFDMYDDNLYVRSIVEYMMVGQALSGLFKGFRDMDAEYGLDVFKDDSNYTYEFALSRTVDQLLALNLGALDFNNPGGTDEDVELYGAAVARHLKNLRGEAANVAAYDYIFEDLLANLTDQRAAVETLKDQGEDALEAGKAELEAGKAALATAKAERDALVVQYNAATDDATKATLQGYIDQYNDQITAGEAEIAAGEAEIAAGEAQIAEAAAGIAQLTQAIDTIVPMAKDEFVAKLEGVYKTYHNTLNYAYDVVATFMQYAASINELVVNADSLDGFNDAASGLIGIIANDFINGAQAKFYYELDKNGVQVTGAPEVPDYVLDETPFADPALCAIAVLAVRYELGNSFFAHPNVEGHAQIATAVLNALVESDAEDFTDTKMDLYMGVLKEKYPNLYAMLMGENNLDDVDDLSIIIQMLKMSNSSALAGMDLDALEAEIRAELRAFKDARTEEQAAEAEVACYRLYKKLIALATATTAVEYVPNENSYYVSLGDSTITGYGLEGYVDGVKNGWLQTVPGAAHTLLAEELFGNNWKNQFCNYCQGSLRADDLLLFLGGDVVLDDYYYAEIEPNLDGTLEETQQAFIAEVQKADLISVAIGGGNFLTFAGKYMNRVLGNTAGDPYELNWARIGVDENDESMKELQEALDLLVPVIDALGLMDQYVPEGVEIENPAKFSRALAEGLIYGYASYNYYYAQVLAKIKEINPDAQLLILGMFNPVDDWTMTTTIDGEETIVNIGGTVANLMESANLQTLAFALQNTNTSYVDVNAAETILEAEKPGVELGFNDYYNSSFQSNGKAVHASVGGHKYIEDQMANALDGGYDAELNDVLEELYEALWADYLTAEEKMDMLLEAYETLKDNGALADYPEVKILEEICALPELSHMTEEKTLAIVQYVYGYMLYDVDGEEIDRELTNFEIRKIAWFVFRTVMYPAPAARTFMLRASSENTDDLSFEEQFAIIDAVYTILKDNGYIDTEVPEIAAFDNLYTELTQPGADKEALLNSETAMNIISNALETMADEEELDQDDVAGLAHEVCEELFGEDSKLTDEAKVKIAELLTDAIVDSGLLGSGEDDSDSSVTDYLEVAKAIIANLKAENLMTDKQAADLIRYLYPVLLNGQDLDPVEVIDKVYGVVFTREDLTLEQKIRIVVVVCETLEEYGYVADAYAMAFAEAKANGYVDQAITYIGIAIVAVDAAKTYAASDIVKLAVPAELQKTYKLLLNELDLVKGDLEEIKGILENAGDYDVDYAKLMALEENLIAHYENIMALADELEIVITPYVEDLNDAVVYYSALVEEIAEETYAWFVNGCEEFAAEYAAWVEEMGKLADKVDPVLGTAVRKYLTETPAESLAILYAYGDEALTKLIVDAAAAGKDVYTIAAALAKVFYDYGGDIYNELLASGEYKLIVDQIEALKAEIEVVLAKIAAAPADSVSNYETVLSGLYAELMAAYEDIYPIVLAAAGQVEATLPGQIDELMTALGNALDVVGEAAGAYGSWFVGHADAMAGALVASLVENTDELLTTACPIIDEIIWAVLNGVNDYLYDTCKAIDAQIWVQIGILEAELEALKAELENAAGEAYEAIMAQIAVVEAKLNALKDAVVDGVYTNYLAAVKALGELKTEVINLANALKDAAMDEAAKAYDAIVDALADLEKAIPTVLAEALETVKEKLGQFGEYLAGKVVEAVKKYAPELADAIYNYLYNNPDEVIAFFTEYGDEMLALAQEYGDEALAVIGVVLYLYGEDIVDYVVENHEAILGAIAGWIDVHGENTAELIQVYAEALGLCGAVREQINVLENAVLDLEAKAQAQIAALQAQIDALNAQLQTATGAAKAEILAKIAELEAQIEAIKAGVEAKIAEVKAAIAELEAAVDAAIKQGLADIAALKAAIENLDEKVAELIEAAKQAAIEELKAAAANVEAALKNLDATIEQLVGEAYVELKALLADAVDYLIDATVEAVKKYAPELADAIYNYLYHNPDEVIAFFHEYGDKLLALAKEYGDEALAVIGGVLYLYGEEIADYVMDHAAEIMDTMVEWVETHGENAWALIQVYLEELGVIEAIENTVENLVTNLEMMAAGAIEKAEELIAQGAARIEAEIAKLEAAKDALIDELEDLKASLEEELKDASEEVKAEVEKAIAEVEKAIAAVEKAIAELEAKLAELKRIAEDIADAAQKVIDAIAMIGEDFQGAVKALKSALEELADALEALEEFVAELNAAIDGVQKEIAEIIAVVTEINEKIGEIVTGTIETLEAVEAIINNVVATIREVAAAIDQAVADLKAAVFNAKYVVLPKCVYSDGLNYVALGGTTTKDGGYVDILADILGESFTVSYENHASAELAYADQLDYVIANAAAIAGADFITYQMDANEIVKNMVDVIIAVNMGGEYTSPDWSEYIDFATVEEVTGEVAATKAEIMKYLDEETIAWIASVEANVIAELEEVLVENGLTDEAIELAKPYVESLVYNMVAYAMETAEAIEAVKTINPTAPVVLVGMYNTLDDVVVKMGGAEINLGDFFAYVVDAVDMYNLIYAVVSGNVTYVDVSEAAVDPAVIDIDEYMGLYVEVEKLLADVEKLTASINPSDLAGMQAIINQINAINAQINALVETANETYVYFMSIIANTANAEGHTYIAEQIANAILVVEHSPVTGHNCDTCGAKLSDCVDDDHDHNCDICGATMGTHEDTDKDHVCDYGCSETIGTCEDADKDHACDYGCDKVYGEHVDTNKDHVCDYGCSETIGTCADADKDHACDYGCDKVYGTCEDKDPVDGKCDYGCGKDFHPEVSVPEIPVDENKGVIGFEVDEDAGILFLDTVQTGMSVEDFVALLKLHVDTEYDADGCDVDIVGDVNGLIATGTQVTVSAKNLAGVDSVTYDIVIVGDTNGDGKVSSGDATLIYQHFCGTLINALNELQLLAGDTNGNDRLESGDATKIFAKYVGAGYETVLK